MATTKAFDSYEIQVNGAGTGRVAMITCFQGQAFVGRIDFHPEGTALPSDFLWHPNTPNTTYVVLRMHIGRFSIIADTLRQETPLKLFIDVNAGPGASTNGRGYVGTGTREPIGELAG